MKKILAFVLVLLLALQALPFAALAEELPHEHEEEEYVTAETAKEETADDELPPEEEPAAEPAPVEETEAPAEETDETAPISVEPLTPVLPDEELTAEAPSAETEAAPVTAEPKAVSAPTSLWLEASEDGNIPSRIDVFKKRTGGTDRNPTYTYQIYLPGNAVIDGCRLSWDGGAMVTVGGTTYASGECPIPSGTAETTYAFKSGSSTLASLKLVTYKGSSGVTPVFIEIDESNGNHTIAEMDADDDHIVECKGEIWIAGTKYELSKMKGRGNATWTSTDDKKPYNITLGKKINFPSIDSAKTKKWSLLAEALDRSLLCNRTGFHLAEQMGIGQDTASADVWMNGEYQGCYTVTPKTDSFVTKNGWMIEQDNYKEDSVAEGGDPQFQLTGLNEASGWSSCYNRITVKKMGDDFLGYDEAGEPDESVANLNAKAAEIQTWLQDAWDAIRSSDGYNSKGKYYTEYIDIESFAKMYLMHEYVKNYDVCAGSILFHRDGQTDADKLIAGPIWDLDNALGSVCSNSGLGSESDRRSAQGSFIANITEYKTSIYKTIGRHADFMEEVEFQYNRYREYFDALPDYAQSLFDEISASAAMNQAKVNDLGNGQYVNLHYYKSATTLGTSPYRQSYVATTTWSNYAANLKTYVTYRSLWFHNNYWDADFVDPATCAHEYAEVIDIAPTCTSVGSATYTCSICKDRYTAVLPKIPHDYQNGACTMCGEVLVTATVTCSDGASVTVYETQDLAGPCEENAVSAHPRDSGTGLIDCSGDGQINFAVVLSPGYVLDGVTAEPAASYKNLKLPEELGIENGYRLTKVKGDLTITVSAHCEHDYTATVTAPTCTEAGYTTYTCGYCGDSYTADEVPALGHDWGAPAYVWTEDNTSVTATRICGRDESHTETETAEAAAEITTPATCEGMGKTTYTAVFGNTAFETQTKVLENVDPLGHDWNAPAYEWTADNSHVTATRTCKRDASHTETETVQTASEVTAPSTCEGKGTTTYTATFENSAFATQTKAVHDIEALGHDWGEPTYEWSADNRTVTAARICKRDATHTETETADAAAEVTTPATCEGMGKTTYTAVFENPVFETQTKTLEDVPATGHTPGDPARENEKAATCTEDGSYDLAVYCTVCHKELSRETKTIPALGHDWGEPTYE